MAEQLLATLIGAALPTSCWLVDRARHRRAGIDRLAERVAAVEAGVSGLSDRVGELAAAVLGRVRA